ncbi:Sec1-like protein [Cucurbitaria berberidis CBS 394.84]|uniref:Sec1-like protein n=1 Tax=Cucurbitaria berberidis CBS 394.84 TaxID=1168544 RepID=A0A9P4GKF5_9PLEO|nr:Sec1-like protein [Cucurbitaria berberidis CBS 394.84]KAF1846730.1 Sec1-like protein [Cucurbitaria berberidis CBS 394.84]
MSVSMIDIQRDLILNTIRQTTRGDWKILIVDEESQKLINNVVKEDDILNTNITNIERLEERRTTQRDMDAIYILTPKAHIVDCIMAEFDQRRYRGFFLIWTTLLPPQLKERIDRSQMAREQIRSFRTVHLDYHPQESHLITFRDPWSFPILYHPECNNLVVRHMEDIAEKITGVCVALGEYPIIRYYRPRNPTHEASVLCSHLARFVQDKLDMYAQFNQDFPPQSNRPRGALYITDRSMDLMAPFVHEFTYQAMAFDLLPIQDGDKVTYRTVVNEEDPEAEEKDMEISDKDRIWVENRHRHMKDTLDKLINDFQKFIADNPHFTNQDAQNAAGMNGLNAIKDMIAGLPQFQEMKEAYSLHLTMAQRCMEIFQKHKLPDLASVEQCLATGLDEDYRKAKNMADQVVRTLDEGEITPADRLRLIALYVIFRDGILPADLQKLLLHAQLPPPDGEVIRNLDLLGARVARQLKEKREPPPPLFPPKPAPPPNAEDYSLSRFNPALQDMLEEHVRGTLPQDVFPFTKMSPDDASMMQDNAPVASLRSAKPTWAKSRLASVEPRQRVIVFVAGGATYSEARACYDISHKTSRDVFLVTSHMVKPQLFLRQVGDLGQNRRNLHLPIDQPPPTAPKHLFEKPEPPKPAPPPAGTKPIPGGLPSGPRVGGPKPPTAAMGAINLNTPKPSPAPSQSSGKHSKDEKDKEKKKKKLHLFSSKH